MLSKYVSVTGWVGTQGRHNMIAPIIGECAMIISVYKTNKSHVIRDKQAERLAKIIYNESKKT